MGGVRDKGLSVVPHLHSSGSWQLMQKTPVKFLWMDCFCIERPKAVLKNRPVFRMPYSISLNPSDSLSSHSLGFTFPTVPCHRPRAPPPPPRVSIPRYLLTRSPGSCYWIELSELNGPSSSSRGVISPVCLL